MATLRDTTQEVIDTHIKNYDKLKNDIVKINVKAEEAIDRLNFYGDGLEPSDNPDEGKKKKKGYQLPAAVKELEVVDEDEEAEVMIAAGGKKFSHEAQKKAMYDQFEFMGRSMRDFGADIEKKLDDVYKGGASSKFGFDDVASVTSWSDKGGLDRQQAKEARELNRIEKEAQDFLHKVDRLKANNSDIDDALSQRSGISAISKGTIYSKVGQKVARSGQAALKPKNMTKQ